MRLLHVLSFFLSFYLLAGNVTAEFSKLESLESLKAIADKSAPETLFVFDVDMVLSQPSDPAFQLGTIDRYRSRITEILSKLTPSQQDQFLNLVATSIPQMRVEETAPAVLRYIATRKHRIVGLTAMMSGSVDSTSHIPTWRSASLGRLGYQMTGSFPDARNFKFTDIEKYLGSHPEFFQGVLYVNGGHGPADKGQVLTSFFRKVGWTPKHVVFADDRTKNLESVANALSRLHPSISFQGLHYVGALKYPSTAVAEQYVVSSWEAIAARTQRDS